MKTNENDNPLSDFSDCHEGIITILHKLGTLPDLINNEEKIKEASDLARELRHFFRNVILKHHLDEESELFEAVREALEHHPDEAMTMRGHIGRLTEEHRYLESLWKRIEPDLRRLERRKPVSLNPDLIQQLCRDYLKHAEFEESEFLPQSERLLSDTEKSALAMSLHIRHIDSTPGPLNYI